MVAPTLMSTCALTASARPPVPSPPWQENQRLREQLLQTPVPNLPAVLDHLEAENAIMVDGDAIYPI